MNIPYGKICCFIMMILLFVIASLHIVTCLRGSVYRNIHSSDNDFDNEERLDGWGYKDSGFVIDSDTNMISFKGSRYQLSRCPKLYAFFNELCGISLPPKEASFGDYNLSDIRSDLSSKVKSELKQICELSDSPAERIKASRGQCIDEITKVKMKTFPELVKKGNHVLVDVIVYPETEEHVVALVDLCKRNSMLKLIPVGGATNVSQSLDLSHTSGKMSVNGATILIAVSTKKMKALKVDEQNRTVTLGPGWIGKDIDEYLTQKYCLTTGMCPDSWEFSTIGGYVATNASGMKKNTYGNMEDMVIDLRMVTGNGILTRGRTTNRTSIGPDIAALAFGSEGNYGIVTSVTIQVRPVPEIRKYQAYLFHTFEDGFKFLKEVNEEGVLPASLRMVDNEQFRFGSSLKEQSTGLKLLKDSLTKKYILDYKKFDEHKMVMVTSVTEGPEKLVEFQRRRITEIANKYGCVVAGEENGKRGYALTECIAYIRDFFLEHSVVGESFETTVPWANTISMIEAVKTKAHAMHCEQKLPGKPCIMCRISQVYNSSVCVYFYYGFYGGQNMPILDAANLFLENETELRKVIMQNEGSLSHHHGIGKIRKGLLSENSEITTSKEFANGFKKLADPWNIFSLSNNFVD